SEERIAKYWAENDCPANDQIDEETGLRLGQTTFLGTKKDMEDIAEAIIKVRNHAAELIES
ncbi:DegT/DnrJ/EryC1/StrS family aminotransferase, partial [bacterium]|nr:DegT/DnrJ/EryC1/StrS family aminotransferase [bacterium]